MTTPAKKDKTAEGAEPEAKTAGVVAEGNAQNAQNIEAANAEQAKADEKTAKDRDALLKRLEALEEKAQKNEEENRKIAEERDALAQRLETPSRQPARLKLRSTALVPKRALQNIQDNWPDQATQPSPMVVVGRTYLVTPHAGGSSENPIAEVSNCEDEGAAKAAYAKALGGRHVSVKVEEIAREEYSQATVDPARAGA